MMKSNRKGFTLVELLIVIVVIGILSAMMMLSSTEAVSSARASNIISNMRNLKTATLSWYADNIERVVKDTSKHYVITVNDSNITFTNFIKSYNSEILKYLSSGSSLSLHDKTTTSNDGDYILIDIDYKKWYVCYKVGSDTRIKEKLASRAGSIGLVGVDNIANAPGTTDYSKENFVCMLVLSLED